MINFESVLKRVGVGVGQTVADLGCGREGHLALLLGKWVGQQGRVYAVDIVKSILPALENKAKMRKIKNIITVWSDLEVYNGAKAIRANTVDLAFLVTILFQSKKQEAILKEAMRILKPGGKLIIIDWKNIRSLFGPPLEMRITPEKIKEIAQTLGLKWLEEYEVSRFHFGLTFVK